MTVVALQGNSTVGKYDDPLWVEQTVPPAEAPRLPKITELIAAIFLRRSRPDPQPNYVGQTAFEVWTTSITALKLAQPAPRLQLQIIELQRLTGWSDRALAGIVGTSHPTIKAAAAGSIGALTRSTDIRERIGSLHAIAIRLAPLADHRTDAIVDALTSRPEGSAQTAVDQVRSSNTAAAYLTAMEVLRPRRRTGMMEGSSPALPGRASAALTD